MVLLFLRPAEADAPTLRLDLQDLHVNDIAHLEQRSKRDLGLVQQAVLLDANVHEGTEIHHIADGTLEHHPNQQVFRFEYIRAQDRRGGLEARVTPRADELLEDVFQRRQTAAQFGSQFLGGDFGGQRLESRFSLGQQ